MSQRGNNPDHIKARGSESYAKMAESFSSNAINFYMFQSAIKNGFAGCQRGNNWYILLILAHHPTGFFLATSIFSLYVKGLTKQYSLRIEWRSIYILVL